MSGILDLASFLPEYERKSEGHERKSAGREQTIAGTHLEKIQPSGVFLMERFWVICCCFFSNRENT